MKNFIKRVLRKIKRIFQKPQIQKEEVLEIPLNRITYMQDNLFTFNNCDFMKDEKFMHAYQTGKATDLGILKNVDFHWRIHVLCWAAKHALNLEGDFAECGVNTGIFSRAITEFIDFKNVNKQLFLLDTFFGLEPKYSSAAEMDYDERMGYKHQNNLYQHVCDQFKTFPNVRIIKGPVPDTLSQLQSEKFAYLSIDMNSVIPEIEALKFFWPKMVKGGVIILDDYGYPGHENQKIAQDEFAKSVQSSILSLPTCQGLLIKHT